MKKWTMRIAVAAFFIFALTDTIGDFISSDPIHYFSQRKRLLFVVAGIALAGGLIAFVCDRMSLPVRHRVKLIALGLAASFTMAFAAGCLFQSVTLLSWIHQSQIYLSDSDRWGALGVFAAMILFPLGIGVLLWVLFCRTYKGESSDWP